jgi:hypothetical protein
LTQKLQTPTVDLSLSVPYEIHYSAALPANLADQARAFQVAAAEIDHRTSASAGADPSPRSQARDVEAWARRTGALIPEADIDALPLVSNSTSEHEVHLRQSDVRAVKRTWAGFYGQVPVPRGGKLDRTNASPAEYLRRMAFQVVVFESDLKLEGASISDKPSMIIGQPAGEPSFVISQLWYERNELATTEEIAELLEESGFVEVPGSYFGWYRLADGVVIVDAKPDNFIKTVAGIVPIDLQMAQFTPEQLAEAGLVSPEGG